MDNSFTLSFEHKGKQYDLASVFTRVGFIHQFHIQMNGGTLIIEFDEEHNYRVIDAEPSKATNIDPDLLKALVDKVSSLH